MLLRDFIPERSLLQPANSQEIHHRTNRSVENVVMRLAMLSRPMVNRNFDDGVPVHFDERREESVHSVKPMNLAKRFGPEGF